MGRDYFFKSEDGRVGDGWSAWAAIVSALGAEEAQSLPTMQDPIWVFGDGDFDSYKHAVVFTKGSDEIGTLYATS